MKKKPESSNIPDRELRIRSLSGREFAAFPVAVFAFVMNRKEEFLLFHRSADRGWETPSGALEAGETPLEGLERELREELGAGVRHRVLGLVHAGAFAYDRRVAHMLSLGYLVRHLGGKVVPSDDMAGARFAWMSYEEIRRRCDIEVPSDPALYLRARNLFGFWAGRTDRRCPGANRIR